MAKKLVSFTPLDAVGLSFQIRAFWEPQAAKNDAKSSFFPISMNYFFPNLNRYEMKNSPLSSSIQIN